MFGKESTLSISAVVSMYTMHNMQLSAFMEYQNGLYNQANSMDLTISSVINGPDAITAVIFNISILTHFLNGCQKLRNLDNPR